MFFSSFEVPLFPRPAIQPAPFICDRRNFRPLKWLDKNNKTGPPLVPWLVMLLPQSNLLYRPFFSILLGRGDFSRLSLWPTHMCYTGVCWHTSAQVCVCVCVTKCHWHDLLYAAARSSPHNRIKQGDSAATTTQIAGIHRKKVLSHYSLCLRCQISVKKVWLKLLSITIL